MASSVDDDTPVTWGQLKRIVEEAGRTAGSYSESRDPHEEIAQGTASIAFAHLETALEDERRSAELKAAVAEDG